MFGCNYEEDEKYASSQRLKMTSTTLSLSYGEYLYIHQVRYQLLVQQREQRIAPPSPCSPLKKKETLGQCSLILLRERGGWPVHFEFGFDLDLDLDLDPTDYTGLALE